MSSDQQNPKKRKSEAILHLQKKQSSEKKGGERPLQLAAKCSSSGKIAKPAKGGASGKIGRANPIVNSSILRPGMAAEERLTAEREKNRERSDALERPEELQRLLYLGTGRRKVRRGRSDWEGEGRPKSSPVAI